jgi:hypothetical protein
MKVKVKVSRDRPRWPKEFRWVKAPDFLDFRHYEGGKVVSWYTFLEAESTPGHTEKIPSDTTGDRSRDPPTRSAVP